MSYTKMNIEIVKYLKQNNLPVTGKSTDTKEETEYRLRSYYKGRDFVFARWIEEEKYHELVSCAHGGWFKAEEFLIPLARHFADEENLVYLKVLCERGIRLNIENLLQSIKQAREELTAGQGIADLAADVLSYPLPPKSSGNGCYRVSVDSIVKWRGKALRKLDCYIGFLEQMESGDYLDMIKTIRDKTACLQIRRCDLKVIKYKIQQ